LLRMLLLLLYYLSVEYDIIRLLLLTDSNHVLYTEMKHFGGRGG
jgi:hypothetical protein